MVTRLDRMLGCMLGGAVGDALGAPVEFMSDAEIRSRFGPDGITEMAHAYGRVGAITDDTQMTLFTLEGVVRTSVRSRSKGISDPVAIVGHAYLRWLHTQGVPWRTAGRTFAHSDAPDGWLVTVSELHSQRAPGNTCLSALKSDRFGSIEHPINDSMGCGGVMRAAPAALIGADRAFRFGCEVAAITHGHPSGYLPAGFLAHVAAMLFDGSSLDDSVHSARQRLRQERGHKATLELVDRAIAMSKQGIPTAQQLESLGGAWVGHEALAIALACAVSTDDTEAAIVAAVNHGGDSDSTGAIAGNLMGAAFGVDAIPPRWLAQLELRDVITELTTDACNETGNTPPSDGMGAAASEWSAKYPGW